MSNRGRERERRTEIEIHSRFSQRDNVIVDREKEKNHSNEEFQISLKINYGEKNMRNI